MEYTLPVVVGRVLFGHGHMRMVVGRVLFGHGHMHIVPTTSGSW